ncbi:MAG: hypothetical protein PHP22_09690 [Oscillospiraceae bacterium]|nr:hypothetical protein [Oscillospiraceae bacterium]
MKRQTSAYERVMFYYSNLGPMYFAFRLKITGTVTGGRLTEALRKTRIEFPLSAVRVEKLPDNRQFITTENVPEYPLTVREDFAGSVTDECISLLRKHFDNEKGPMVRFKLLRNGTENHLLAVFQHAVVDGIAAVIFLERLMEHLGDPDLIPVAPDDDSWAPMLNKIVSPENMKIIGSFDPPEYKNNKDYTKYTPKGATPEPFPILPFNVHAHAFSKSETDSIVAAAKACGTTVHAYVGAMILQSFAEEFGPADGYTRTIQSPINFRSQLRAGSERLFGLFNGLITAKSDCLPGRPTEEIAREIGQKLHDRIESRKPLSGYYNFMSYLLDGVDDPEEFYANREGHTIEEYDFSFSNLGRIEMASQYGDLAVTDVYGPTFSATRGERVIGALTFDGRLFMNMIYDSNCFEPAMGQRIWERIVARVSSVTP